MVNKMYKKLDGHDLKREFENYNRDYYSIEACNELVDYYTQFNENVELDVIGICCDWTEYDEQNLITDYEYLLDDDFDDDEEKLDEIISEIEYNTTIIYLDNGNYLVRGF